MSTLANHVKDNFAGMLVFGDIHSDYKTFMSAYEFATANNLFFMSLGDLVDRGSFPYETISGMLSFIKAGTAGFVPGNHDDKFYRLSQGKTSSFSVDAKRTLADVGPEREVEFLRMYAEIFETPVYTSLFHTFGDFIMVHAASHPHMWDSTVKFSKGVNSRALYGETNGERYDDGYPVRLYSWIDEIPMGKTVFVGHDRAPIHNVAITEPMTVTNSRGGRAIFMDTGCGKGGFLSGAIITTDRRKFKFDRFVDFK